MEPTSATRIRTWLDTLPRETRERLFLLLDELCAGMDASRHNEFGFLRLRAEFETSGELFGCTIAELRDAIAETLGDLSGLRPPRPPSPPGSASERGRIARVPRLPLGARWPVSGRSPAEP